MVGFMLESSFKSGKSASEEEKTYDFKMCRRKKNLSNRERCLKIAYAVSDYIHSSRRKQLLWRKI